MATGTAVAQNAPTDQNGQTYKAYGSPATTVVQTGTLPHMENKIDMVTLRDLEAEAQKVIGLPVIVKRILSAEQALEAERRGCLAVWLSNHGGRQLDNVSSALTVLPSVAAALKGRISIIVDGGIFRGQDVFRALAL